MNCKVLNINNETLRIHNNNKISSKNYYLLNNKQSENISFGADCCYMLKKLYPNNKGLSLYLDSIAQYKPLKRDKITELFIEKEKHGINSELIREKIIQANLKLVLFSVLKLLKCLNMPILDFIQEGNLALMKAVDSYSYKKNCSFSTYAVGVIKFALYGSLAKSEGLVYMPEQLAFLNRKINFAEEKLFAKCSQKITDSDISKLTGLSVDEIKKIRKFTPKIISIDKPIYTANDRHNFTLKNNYEATNDSFCVFADTLENNSLSLMEREINNNEIHDVLEHFSTTHLKPTQKYVLKKRYPDRNSVPETLDEIGKSLNLTRARICEINKTLISKLKKSKYKDILKELSYVNS